MSYMKQTNLLFCVLSFLLFSITGGCNGSQKSDVLGRADSILDHHPDSALKILQAINADSLSGRKDKARYGLLLFAALTKIGNQPETDSILKPALSFYGKGKTPSREKMLTHFFHANFLVNNDKLAESILEYDKAINIGEAINDTLYPALGYISK